MVEDNIITAKKVEDFDEVDEEEDETKKNAVSDMKEQNKKKNIKE